MPYVFFKKKVWSIANFTHLSAYILIANTIILLNLAQISCVRRATCPEEPFAASRHWFLRSHSSRSLDIQEKHNTLLWLAWFDLVCTIVLLAEPSGSSDSHMGFVST